MSIKIPKPGILTTLVSDGRVGFRSLGIGPGGPMDFFAMKIANYLVGNDREAVLEIGYSSAELLMQNDCVISVTGKGFEVKAGDLTFPMWKPIKVKSGSTLALKKTIGGAWIYVSVAGGWEAEEWLGSFTTNLNAKAGGYLGRAFQKGDVVEASDQIQFDESKILPWGISTNEIDDIYSPVNIIRCIPSVESDLIDQTAGAKFASKEFTVTNQSNRMGYRMSGDVLSLLEKIELVSSPVDFGTVQLLPDGNIIVLMADHQTTGGYPRIASVIKADLPKLAQTLPGETINFQMISFQEAEVALISIEKKIVELKKSCHDRFKNYFQA
jgi:antagonist of KipI